MDVATSGQGSRFVFAAVNHCRLTKLYAASVRSFLQMYEANVREVTERASQLTEEEVTITEATAPVRLQFWVNQKWLEPTVDPGLLPGVERCADLTEHTLHD